MKKTKKDDKALISNVALALGILCFLIVWISCFTAIDYRNNIDPDCKWSFADYCVWAFMGLTLLLLAIAANPGLVSIEGFKKIMMVLLVIALAISIIVTLKDILMAITIQIGCLGK